MPEFVDIVVPRGGKGLIERLMRESRVPMIKHLDGICHVYIDAGADLDMAVRIADNAKTQRYGTCNTMETLLVAERVADELLPRLGRIYAAKGVELRGDAATCALLQRVGIACVAASEEDWRAEYLAPILAIRVVADLDEAIAHINTYGSRHTDAIVTDRPCGGDALPARGRLGLGDRQRVDTLRRRLRVRPRRRNWHQQRQAACARPGRPRRADLAEIRRVRPRRSTRRGCADPMTGYAWVKTLHLVFVISWFAGLFYLPRIFVNLADTADAATRDRLLVMARKLLRFMSGLGFLAVGFGLVLWAVYGVGNKSGWMSAKLVLVLGLVVYHVWCALLYKRFATATNTRSHVWFRWFNEVPVLMLFAIVALAVGKPF